MLSIKYNLSSPDILYNDKFASPFLPFFFSSLMLFIIIHECRSCRCLTPDDDDDDDDDDDESKESANESPLWNKKLSDFGVLNGSVLDIIDTQFDENGEANQRSLLIGIENR